MSTLAIGRSLGRRPIGVAALWRGVAVSRPLAYLVFFALYLPATLMLAHTKLLWDDEFFTLYLSSVNWGELVRALSTGADQHPPSFYYATHLLTSALGASNITVRLISIAGFAAMCCCLYEIVGRMLGREWGFCAMLLPLACPNSWYAVEARGYAAELGFVSLAFLAWMLATAGRRRWIALPLLALSLCAAVGSHYYAGAVLLAFGAGEGVRTLVNRRIDWPVWLAFGGALIPVLAFAKLIGSARGYSGHFWAIPKWSYMVTWYPDALGYVVAVPLAIAALVAIRSSGRARAAAPDRPLQPWHTAAFVMLAFVPVALLVLAKLVTHAFHARYAIAAFPGVCVLLTIGVARMSNYSTRFAAASWVMLLVCYGGMSMRAWTMWHAELVDLRETAQFLREHSDGPVAVSHITRFHRLSFYARRDLGARVVYASDPEASVRFLGFDTVDRGLLALNEWFPLNVRWFGEWVAERPSFLLLGPISEWSWAPAAVAKSGAEVRLSGVSAENLLLSVSGLKWPDSRGPNDPSGRPMLYSRMPATGRPLCEVYLSAGSCPNVD